jgi:hypothetical protein
MLYLSILRKSGDITQVPYRSDKNDGTLHEDRYTFLIIYRSVLLSMRDVSDRSVYETKTHKSCRLLDNVEKRCTAK